MNPLLTDAPLPAELLRSGDAERTIPCPELGGRVLLAVDTALGTSVALGVGGKVFECSSDDPLRHAEVIGTMLARVFAASGASPAAVTGVVAGIGPGPFTGLRIGIAAAHAFATGRGVPLLPLQGHEAAALAVLESGVGRDPAAPDGVRVVQDAKRRELFVTEYRALDSAGVPVRSRDAHLLLRAELVASDLDVWPERIPAARLVQLAARRLADGCGFEEDRALYLRAPDIAQPVAPKRVST